MTKQVGHNMRFVGGPDELRERAPVLGSDGDAIVEIEAAADAWGADRYKAAHVVFALRQRLEAAEKLAGFLRSVIQSGEPWTATCQQEYDAALKEKPNE